MGLFKKLISFIILLLLVMNLNVSGQVIVISNINIGDRFKFSFTEYTSIETVNGTNYQSELPMINQPYTIEVTGGEYYPEPPTTIVINNTIYLTFRPYNASIKYTATYDNETLNKDTPTELTAPLDVWVDVYSLLLFVGLMHAFFSPAKLVGDYGVPKQDSVSDELTGFGVFVNNNETYYEKFISNSSDPITFENQTITEDGLNITTMDELAVSQSMMDKEKKLVELNYNYNITQYGNIGEIEWLYSTVVFVGLIIDYGRGITIKNSYGIIMKSDYDDASLYSEVLITVEEYMDSNPTPNTTTTGDDEVPNSSSLELNYPMYSLFTIFGIATIKHRKKSTRLMFQF